MWIWWIACASKVMGKKIKINKNLYKTQACMTYSTPWLWNICIEVIVFYAELNLFKGYSFTNQPLISAHPSTWAQLFCPSKNNVNMVSVYGKLDQSCYVPYLVFIFAKPFCKKNFSFFPLRTYSPVTLGSLQLNCSVLRRFADYVLHSECNPYIYSV